MIKSDPTSRFVIGIDLGTTNCALAYVDTEADDLRPQTFLIEQWDSEGALIRAETLPSFYYLPVKAEWKRGQLALPWDAAAQDGDAATPDFAVGRLAQLKASQNPGRVIHAAKSWLCHAGVDRRDRILPWHSDDVIGDERRSPIEVSAAYLHHLRKAWNHAFCGQGEGAIFEGQEIVITVPASFDEVAQRLTLEAAHLAGFPRERLKLLEEPQAAFYEWLGNHHQDLEATLRRRDAGRQTILVCDIGGGTTDFSLLSVTWNDGQRPDIQRIGVSEHLLLGGDNIDLSLAHILEQKLLGDGRSLSSRQWAQLVFEARQLKEKALRALSQEDAPRTAGSAEDELFVSLAGEGASLLATAMTVGIRPREIQQHLIEGFFPKVLAQERPIRARGALTQLGLPYAADSAITKHLAQFLEGQSVDAILFAGGTVKPCLVRERIVDQMAAWQGRKPHVLTSSALDLAVSRGAAAYGLSLRQGQSAVHVGGGYPRSLYVEVASLSGIRNLVCIVPKGFASTRPFAIQTFGLKAMTERPVRFRLFSATNRGNDAAGDVVPWVESQFHPLPSLDTKLDLGGKIPGDQLVDVTLEVALLPTGILDMACVALGEKWAGHRWQLEFRMQEAEEPMDLAGVSTERQGISTVKLDLARQKVDALYGKKKRSDTEEGNPKYLVRDLEGLLGMPREAWDTGFLRALWPHLEQGLTRRSRSVGHELSWLYLAGFALRPGYGCELDEWRVKELWRAYDLGLAFPKERQTEEQWWILWRRVAGGLSRQQQEQIFARIFPQIRKGEAVSAEVYMLAGSLERIEMGQKVRLGQQLVREIGSGRKQHLDQKMWALARIASRVPLYAGPQAIVRPAFIESWAEAFHGLNLGQPPYQRLIHFYSQAGRVIGDREFDLAPELRSAFLKRLAEGKAADDLMRPVRELVPFAIKDRSQLFGESLPAGLWLGVESLE